MGILSKLFNPNNGTAPNKDKDGNLWISSFDFYPSKTGSHTLCFEGHKFIEGDYWSRTSVVVKVQRKEFGTKAELTSEVEKAEFTKQLVSNFRKHLKSNNISICVPFAAEIDSVANFYNKFFRFVMRIHERLVCESEYVLVEDKIEGHHEQFTDGNGKATESCPAILEAFGHFVYASTVGDCVITGIQGVQTGKDRWVLTSPRVHSVSRNFGSRNGGQSKIDQFLQNHHCNSICKDWPLSAQDFCCPNKNLPFLPSAPVISPPPYDSSLPPPYTPGNPREIPVPNIFPMGQKMAEVCRVPPYFVLNETGTTKS